MAVRRPSPSRPDLAEISAAAQIGQHQFAARMRLRHLHESDANQVEAVGDVALAADHVALGVAHQLHLIAQQVDELGRQRGEHRDAAQMVVERALAIVGVELRLERLVALHDVEDVAQHLEHHAIGGSAHRGRARIQAHAGHFAEQIAGAERRPRDCRTADPPEHRWECVRRSPSSSRRSCWRPSEAAGQLAEEAGGAASGLDVGDGRREKTCAWPSRM